jgi:hypothetical protein
MLNVDIGKALAFDITPEQLDTLLSHEAVKSRIMYIGLRNILMDSHAGQSRDKFDTELLWRNASKAVAEKTLAAMLEGRVREKSTGVRASSLSPVMAEAIRLAKSVILPKQKDEVQMAKWAEAFGLELGNGSKEAKHSVLIEAIKRYAAKPMTQELAQKNVDAKAALIVDDLDL